MPENTGEPYYPNDHHYGPDLEELPPAPGAPTSSSVLHGVVEVQPDHPPYDAEMQLRLVVVTALVLFAGSCSNSDDTQSAEPSSDPVAEAVDYSQPGDYAAGVTTLELEDRSVEVWYPADPSVTEGMDTEVFNVLMTLPDSFSSFVPDGLSGDIDTGAYRDVPGVEGDHPIIIYSHGFGGYRQVATYLTSHLASHGFVVVSVDHIERGLVQQALGDATSDPQREIDDLDAAIALVAEGDASADSPLSGVVDTSVIGITGHSAGGGTSTRYAELGDRVLAFSTISAGTPAPIEGDEIGVRGIALSPDAPDEVTVEVLEVSGEVLTVSVDGTDPQTVDVDREKGAEVEAGGGTATLFFFPPDSDQAAVQPGTVVVSRLVPDKPSLVILGDDDQVVTAERSRSQYAVQPSPKVLVGVAGAGHNSFTDSCARIIEFGGLGELEDLIGSAQVARAEDGCTPEASDPEVVQAAVRHATTAFFLAQLLGEDATPSLTQDAITEYSGAELSDHSTAPA